MWEAPNGKLYFVLPDGNLLLTAENLEPGPTLEWLLANDPHHDDDFDPADLVDAFGRP